MVIIINRIIIENLTRSTEINTHKRDFILVSMTVKGDMFTHVIWDKFLVSERCQLTIVIATKSPS